MLGCKVFFVVGAAAGGGGCIGSTGGEVREEEFALFALGGFGGAFGG